LGETAANGARTPGGAAAPAAEEQLVDDVRRIAGSVRDVLEARATMISRVVDDEWLEVIAVVGDPSEGIVEGLRWRRSDLQALVAGAEHRGRLRLTKQKSVSYAEVPDSVPETERYIAGHRGLLIAPLHSAHDDLLGVLTTEGPVEIVHPEPGVCELVELYAGQARIALGAQRDRGRLTERLRVSHAAHAVFHDATRADDLPDMLENVARGVCDMMRADAVWACAEMEPGMPAAAAVAAYPPEVDDRLGDDVLLLLEPMLVASLAEERPLSHDHEPLLGRLAEVAGMEHALLAPLGDGTNTRGALLVLREGSRESWTGHDLDAVFGLGRRLGTLIDRVHDRRRDHETLQALLRLQEDRRNLVASITHDLKTPLTAIALNTELLESDGRLEEAGSHPVAAIRRSADRLSSLVDDLLAMARTEEGIGSMVEADLVAMVRQACEDAGTEASLRRVTFDIDAPEELWLKIDAHAVERVLANLVTNAVKFSLPRGRVKLSVSRVESSVVFRCSDEGIGIPAERLDSIFEVSPRMSEAHEDEIPGSGIGLVICARIVERLGGRIEVESRRAEGSTFTVILPC
jgi:signal transduction histidine kinase